LELVGRSNKQDAKTEVDALRAELAQLRERNTELLISWRKVLTAIIATADEYREILPKLDAEINPPPGGEG
jgi:hypothetical protein